MYEKVYFTNYFYFTIITIHFELLEILALVLPKRNCSDAFCPLVPSITVSTFSDSEIPRIFSFQLNYFLDLL